MIRRFFAARHARWPRFSPHYFVRLARLSGVDVSDCECGARMFREQGPLGARQVILEQNDPRAGRALWDPQLLRGSAMGRGSFVLDTPQSITLTKSAGGLH